MEGLHTHARASFLNGFAHKVRLGGASMWQHVGSGSHCLRLRVSLPACYGPPLSLSSPTHGQESVASCDLAFSLAMFVLIVGEQKVGREVLVTLLVPTHFLYLCVLPDSMAFELVTWPSMSNGRYNNQLRTGEGEAV